MTDNGMPIPEDTKWQKGQRARKRLAAIIFAELDIEIDPDRLAHMIVNNWSKIAPLAHLVHAAEDRTKQPPVGQVGDEKGQTP